MMELTRLRPSIGDDQPWTLVPRPTSAGAPPSLLTWDNGSEARQTPENIPVPPPKRPSKPTNVLPIRTSSFGNGAPETGNPIHRKQKPLYSIGSRLSPLTRRIANESSPVDRVDIPRIYRPWSGWELLLVRSHVCSCRAVGDDIYMSQR